MLSPKRPAPPVTVEPASYDTVQVPRAHIQEHGWPDSFAALVVLAQAEPGRLVHAKREVGTLMGEAYTAASDLAWFREGPQGQANLFVQGWRGPA